MNLPEQYRPRTWSDVVGQSKVIETIDRMRPRGLSGRAYFLSGASGTGKTTIAMLLAEEVAEPVCIEEYDAGELTGPLVRDLERRLAVKGFGKGGRAIVVNEAHGLKPEAIRALLVALERIPAHALWCLTTTAEGRETLFDKEDSSPLLSRCLRLDLARRDLAKAFAERAQQIAQREGLDGQPIEKYLRLLQEHRNNLRAALQAIETGAMLA
jgi:DNA polymerase III gamma/tau subunit